MIVGGVTRERLVCSWRVGRPFVRVVSGSDGDCTARDTAKTTVMKRSAGWLVSDIVVATVVVLSVYDGKTESTSHIHLADIIKDPRSRPHEIKNSHISTTLRLRDKHIAVSH